MGGAFEPGIDMTIPPKAKITGTISVTDPLHGGSSKSFVTYAPTVVVTGSGDLKAGGGHGLDLPDLDQAIEPETLPPRTAEFILWIILSRIDREAILGDLEQDFLEAVDKFGPRHAKFFYWSQVLRSLGSLVWKLIKRAEDIWKFFGG